MLVMPSEWVWVPDDAGAMSTRPMPTWSSARLMPMEVRTWPRQPLDGSCHSCDCDLDGGGQLSISMFELLLRRSVWVASTARTHSATSLRSWPMQLLARIVAARRDVSSRCLACFTGPPPVALTLVFGDVACVFRSSADVELRYDVRSCAREHVVFHSCARVAQYCALCGNWDVPIFWQPVFSRFLSVFSRFF